MGSDGTSERPVGHASLKDLESLNMHPVLIAALSELGWPRLTALQTQVLARTMLDFADVLLDSRCATGSTTAGTASSIWLHNNNSGSKHTTPDGLRIPLYNMKIACQDRWRLLLLYAAHCLLTTGALRADRRASLPEVALVVAASEASAAELQRIAEGFTSACGMRVLVVPDGEQPPALVSPLPAADPSMAATSKGTETALGDAASESRGQQKTKDVRMDNGVILIATFAGLQQWDRQAFLTPNLSPDGPPGEQSFPPRITAVLAEDVGAIQACGGTMAWESILKDIHRATDAASTGYPVIHQSPHYLWMCLGPLSALHPRLRWLLSRRNRRHYALLPTSHVHSYAAAVGAYGVGKTSPFNSTHTVCLMATSERDKEELLKAIISASSCFNRILALTHHKDIRTLHSTIAKWEVGPVGRKQEGSPVADTISTSGGILPTSPMLGSGTASCAGSTASLSTERHYCVQRSDSHARQLEMLLGVTQYDSVHKGVGKSDERTLGTESAVQATVSSDPALLVAWDAYTAVDVMDVDTVLQYHPPQKSLSVREWAEYIQVLHTTGDGEIEIEASLRANPQNTEQHVLSMMTQVHEGLSLMPLNRNRYRFKQRPPAIITLVLYPDFSLAAYLMQQYHYSGGTGQLSPEAASSSLSAVHSSNNSDGTGNALVPSSNPANVPILNISPSHPLFVHLVSGWEGYCKGERPCGLEDPINVRNVLKHKLAMEKASQMRGRDSHWAAGYALNFGLGGKNVTESSATPPTVTASSGRGQNVPQRGQSDGKSNRSVRSSNHKNSANGGASASGRRGSTSGKNQTSPAIAAQSGAGGGAAGGGDKKSQGKESGRGKRGGRSSRDAKAPSSTTLTLSKGSTSDQVEGMLRKLGIKVRTEGK